MPLHSCQKHKQMRIEIIIAFKEETVCVFFFFLIFNESLVHTIFEINDFNVNGCLLTTLV
jgi:hypothetical protein